MNYIIIPVIASLFLLQGCSYKVNNLSLVPDKESYQITTKYEKISQDEAALLGFVWLPMYIDQLISKKNDYLYICDSLYENDFNSFEPSKKNLKEMYEADGWVICEEVLSEAYGHIFLKKVDREMVIFIEERDFYNKEKKKKEKRILLHQSLLVL